MKWFSIISLFGFSLLSGELALAEKLKVLTYNTWGVPVVVWDTWRYSAAMKAIEALDPDIVVLDEVFSHRGRKAFVSKKYPYTADGGGWFPRMVRSGTRILSKYPIDLHATLTYRACKKDDCLSRKGATLITVSLPQDKKINIIGTHLNAAGTENTRIDQLKQLKIFSETYRDKNAPTLFVGDFNLAPQSESYTYLKKNLNVRDSWEETHPASEPGITYDTDSNHYARDYTRKTGGSPIHDRIDYLFPRGAITTLSSQLIFNQENQIFSDHYGILAEYDY